jgi:hypothetical protein
MAVLVPLHDFFHKRGLKRYKMGGRVAESVFRAIIGVEKYEGGKSASGARQSRCDVGAG